MLKKGKFMNLPSWIVIVPPILVLLFTALTKRINLSFFLSIIIASLLASEGSFFKALDIIKEHASNQITDLASLYQYSFLLIIGILIVLLDNSGGAKAFAYKFTHHIKSAKAAENTAMLISGALDIDDFLSNSTAGYIMRPITDKFKIARAKLAYLTHGISTPLIMILPISSWIAMIISRLSEANITPITHNSHNAKIISDPYFVFLATIPFAFYSILAIISIIFVVNKRISFGPMRKHEQIAKSHGNLFGDSVQVPINIPDSSSALKPSMLDFIIPLATLIASFIVGTLYMGNYHLFGGSESFINAFKNVSDTSLNLAMLIAGILSVMISIALAIPRGKLTFWSLPKFCKEGACSMLAPIIMLFLASVFRLILQDNLHTGNYVANALTNILTPYLVAPILFAVALATSFLMGTSWGTIALLMPMATPIITAFSQVTLPTTPDQLPLLYPVLGSIFSGAICGDQLSPISQTTIMASNSVGINSITHAKTQIPYAIPPIIATIFSYLLSGLCAQHNISTGWKAIICLTSGATFSCIMLYLVHQVAHLKKEKNS